MAKRGEERPERETICLRWAVEKAAHPREDKCWRHWRSPLKRRQFAFMNRLASRVRLSVIVRDFIGDGTPPVMDAAC